MGQQSVDAQRADILKIGGSLGRQAAIRMVIEALQPQKAHWQSPAE